MRLAARACCAVGLLTLLGAGCSASPEQVALDCTPATIWRVVSEGGDLACPDADEALSSAIYLATRYAEFSSRLEALEGLATERTLTGPERLERVEIIREMDQIVGIAGVRGWREAQPQTP